MPVIQENAKALAKFISEDRPEVDKHSAEIMASVASFMISVAWINRLKIPDIQQTLDSLKNQYCKSLVEGRVYINHIILDPEDNKNLKRIIGAEVTNSLGAFEELNFYYTPKYLETLCAPQDNSNALQIYCHESTKFLLGRNDLLISMKLADAFTPMVSALTTLLMEKELRKIIRKRKLVGRNDTMEASPEISDELRTQLFFVHITGFFLAFAAMTADIGLGNANGIFAAQTGISLYLLYNKNYLTLQRLSWLGSIGLASMSVITFASGYFTWQEHSRHGGIPDWFIPQVLIAVFFVVLSFFTSERLGIAFLNNSNGSDDGSDLSSEDLDMEALQANLITFLEPSKDVSEPDPEPEPEPEPEPKPKPEQIRIVRQETKSLRDKLSTDKGKQETLTGGEKNKYAVKNKLLEKYRPAFVARKYRKDAAQAWGEIEKLPLQYQIQYLERLSKDPKADVDTWVAEFKDHFDKQNQPFETKELNEKYQLLKKLNEKAAVEFKNVINMLGTTVDSEEVYSEIAYRYKTDGS